MMPWTGKGNEDNKFGPPEIVAALNYHSKRVAKEPVQRLVCGRAD